MSYQAEEWHHYDQQTLRRAVSGAQLPGEPFEQQLSMLETHTALEICEEHASAMD